jgi:hypothetical protein
MTERFKIAGGGQRLAAVDTERRSEVNCECFYAEEIATEQRNKVSTKYDN